MKPIHIILIIAAVFIIPVIVLGVFFGLSQISENQSSYTQSFDSEVCNNKACFVDELEIQNDVNYTHVYSNVPTSQNTSTTPKYINRFYYYISTVIQEFVEIIENIKVSVFGGRSSFAPEIESTPVNDISSDCNALTINPQWEEYNCKTYPQNSIYDNFPSISGYFDGVNYDTLTLFPFSGFEEDDAYYYNKWIIISQYGTIPSIVVDTYHPYIVYENDLDKNGKDEFAVLKCGMHGTWGIYTVYTYYNNKVEVFLSMDYWDNGDYDLTDIVCSADTKGKVSIIESIADPLDSYYKKSFLEITKFLR